MASHTVENYLKALFALANKAGEVGISDLSDHLAVSKPSVNSMAKALQQDGFLKYEKYKPLKLTSKGKKVAALVVRKHRLTEMFLVEQMGFGWDEVHDIAEQVEHVKAPAFFDRMDELVGFPTVDPHGSPIPDAHGNVLEIDCVKLSECAVGEKVSLVGLSQSSKSLLSFLDSHGIALGHTFGILAVEPFDGSMTVEHQGAEARTFSLKVCERLLVRKEA
jgi:DtxR family Mn-dependent transcriptional regulator